MLRWMSVKTKNDRIRNEDIRDDLGVAPIKDDDMRENTFKIGSAMYIGVQNKWE